MRRSHLKNKMRMLKAPCEMTEIFLQGSHSQANGGAQLAQRPVPRHKHLDQFPAEHETVEPNAPGTFYQNLDLTSVGKGQAFKTM